MPMDFPAGDARRRVVAFLAFLTSEECRRAYAAHLPPEQLAYALARLWFDDLYAPSLRYLHGLKGDLDAAVVRRFEAAFSPDERAALARFHRFFELRIDMLPPEAHRDEIILQNAAWEALVRHAGYVLEHLAVDPTAVRLHLAQALADGLPAWLPAR